MSGAVSFICNKGVWIMECPFCCFLYDYIGEYVRVGVVCNCDTNDHIYRDGYIQRRSFNHNILRLYSSPSGGNVIFTTCCDNIFELYIFPNDAGARVDAATMAEQRLSLLKKLEGSEEGGDGK